MDIRNLLNPETENLYVRDTGTQASTSTEPITPTSRDTSSQNRALSPENQPCAASLSDREATHKAKRQFENLFQEYKAKIKRKLADLASKGLNGIDRDDCLLVKRVKLDSGWAMLHHVPVCFLYWNTVTGVFEYSITHSDVAQLQTMNIRTLRFGSVAPALVVAYGSRILDQATLERLASTKIALINRTLRLELWSDLEQLGKAFQMHQERRDTTSLATSRPTLPALTINTLYAAARHSHGNLRRTLPPLSPFIISPNSLLPTSPTQTMAHPTLASATQTMDRPANYNVKLYARIDNIKKDYEKLVLRATHRMQTHQGAHTNPADYTFATQQNSGISIRTHSQLNGPVYFIYWDPGSRQFGFKLASKVDVDWYVRRESPIGFGTIRPVLVLARSFPPGVNQQWLAAKIQSLVLYFNADFRARVLHHLAPLSYFLHLKSPQGVGSSK
ncbi:hypothetical protein H4R34_000681 [Dimargaris verticillata]|uniref:Uncharacterized protein n=1 Tax=Dimargaris verticillata TaxID=2761393 RepID=A0A9W8EF67_9FUNG|nr:hypothetical protein H4R34_000681 [Dimargaris verticillata]